MSGALNRPKAELAAMPRSASRRDRRQALQHQIGQLRRGAGVGADIVLVHVFPIAVTFDLAHGDYPLVHRVHNCCGFMTRGV
jgi:hypothetical protein